MNNTHLVARNSEFTYPFVNLFTGRMTMNSLDKVAGYIGARMSWGNDEVNKFYGDLTRSFTNWTYEYKVSSNKN